MLFSKNLGESMRTDPRSRPNFAMKWIVEDGVALAGSVGHCEAAAYLAARGVADSVIARVLFEPGRRRSLPWELYWRVHASRGHESTSK